MRKTKTSATLLLVLLVAGALAACGNSGDDGTTTGQGSGGYDRGGAEKPVKPYPPSVPNIIVRDGAPVGGVAELDFDAGDTIRFTVSSDLADEVHVHGYEVEEEVPAAGTATLAFPADIEGIFEVELHGSEVQIAELRVNP